MKSYAMRGDLLQTSLVEQAVELLCGAFKEEHSPIALHRHAEEYRQSLTAKESQIFIVEDQGRVKAVGAMISVAEARADELVPWVNFDFYREGFEHEVYFISLAAVSKGFEHKRLGTMIFEEMFRFLSKEQIAIVSFDCNVFYSGYLPGFFQKYFPIRLFPSQKFCQALIEMGRHGLHANPVWYACFTNAAYQDVVNKHKKLGHTFEADEIEESDQFDYDMVG